MKLPPAPRQSQNLLADQLLISNIMSSYKFKEFKALTALRIVGSSHFSHGFLFFIAPCGPE